MKNIDPKQMMKQKRFIKKSFLLTAMIGFITAMMAVSVRSIHPVWAANSGAVDTSKTGSITIHKYDMTAASAKGIDFDKFTSTGKQDTSAEETLKDFAIKGVEFSYLRIGDVEQMSEDGKIKVVYEVPSELQTIIGLSASNAAKTSGSKFYFTSQQINGKLAEALADNTVTKDKLEDYIGKDGTAMDFTDANGITQKNNLELGLYLIIETKVPEDVTYTTNPFFVQLPMTDNEGDGWFYDVVCYPKNQTGVPTLEKKVRNSPDQSNVTTSKEGTLADFTSAREEYAYADTVTASENETLDYELISKLPHITSKSTYLTTYTFNDVLERGITYGNGAVVALYDNKEAAATNVNNADDSGALVVWKASDPEPKFKADYGKQTEGDATMKISFTASGLAELNKKYSDKYIAIYYTANVNDTAVLGDQGNRNDVSLTWKRTNTNQYDILRDRCIVYTYGINLTKKFTDDHGDPTKVKFVMQNTTDHYFLKATGNNGIYYVTGKAATRDEATQFSPAADGTLKINGAEADTYALTETLSDVGYSTLKNAVMLKITSTKADITPINDGNVQGSALADQVAVQTTPASATIDEKAATMLTSGESKNALINMEITNSKGFLLPQTGGRGIYLVTVVGIIIAAAGCSIMRHKKK